MCLSLNAPFNFAKWINQTAVSGICSNKPYHTDVSANWLTFKQCCLDSRPSAACAFTDKSLLQSGTHFIIYITMTNNNRCSHYQPGEMSKISNEYISGNECLKCLKWGAAVNKRSLTGRMFSLPHFKESSQISSLPVRPVVNSVKLRHKPMFCPPVCNIFILIVQFW